MEPLGTGGPVSHSFVQPIGQKTEEQGPNKPDECSAVTAVSMRAMANEGPAYTCLCLPFLVLFQRTDATSPQVDSLRHNLDG